MDKSKIMIINLSKGKVGEGNANLLGSMLITKIYLAAMSRADRDEKELAKLPNFYLYVDEFQSFANKSFADILSEARKYKLNLTIAHQYIEQMEEEVRDAVFGNVGTMIMFRVGAFDAEVLEKEFAPTFTAEDMVNLGFIQIYLKLMIDGVSSKPFSAMTMGPISKPDIVYKEDVIKSSREQFARPKVEVEKGISDWHDSGSGKDANKDINKNNQKADYPPQNRSNNQNNENNNSKQNRDLPHKKSEGAKVEPLVKVDENKLVLMRAAEELRNREKISLSSLAKEKELSMQVGKKNPSKENLSSLKEALAGVLTKKPEEKKEHSEPRVLPKRSEGSKTSEPIGSKEVPEDVLRKILQMDDGK